MADMRDRLIELLKGAETKVTEVLSKPLALEEWLAIYADHLLANGVILPPCKVGDVLWDISEFLEGREHPEMYMLYADEIAIGGDGFFAIDGCSVRFEDFGKIVFLTREEAEKALREKDE